MSETHNFFFPLCLGGGVYEVFYPEDRQSRWASDGVHIDGLCSAVGIIGMRNTSHPPGAYYTTPISVRQT